jgi:hypothetical protein
MKKLLLMLHNMSNYFDLKFFIYLSSFSKSRNFPFFFQKTVGVGIPFGGEQISLAVSPLSTP